MAYEYSLLGLDTLELIGIGYEKSFCKSWALMDHEGPVLDIRALGHNGADHLIMLPKVLLEKLYDNFRTCNPSGVTITFGEDYRQYAPSGLSEDELYDLIEEDKIFAEITEDDHYAHHLFKDKGITPRICELLPELQDSSVLERLATDPGLDQRVMNNAYKEGVLDKNYGSRHKRWSKPWLDYVADYKEKNGIVTQPWE